MTSLSKDFKKEFLSKIKSECFGRRCKVVKEPLYKQSDCELIAFDPTSKSRVLMKLLNDSYYQYLLVEDGNYYYFEKKK